MPCSHCDKSPASKKCPCLGATYCDSTCQKADWKRHKPSCPPYRIQQIPGKGKGMVATRKLKVGAVILQESPLLSVDGDGGQQESVQKNVQDVLSLLHLSRTLPDDQKQKVLSLHDPGESSKQQSSLSAMQRIGFLKEGISNDELKFVRIVLANWISVCYTEFGVNASALYEDVSRINHSCVPNCVWSWKKDDVYAKQVSAIKNIEKGEEIVASYIDDNMFRLRKDRGENLKNWNFECHCEICSLEEDELKKNEELRSKIMKLQKNIPKFSMRGDVSNALSAAKEKLELMSKIEDEVILKMPEALLELYALSIVWGNVGNVFKGSRKKKLKEETDEYKNRAFTLASKLGGWAIYGYEKEMKKVVLWELANK